MSNRKVMTVGDLRRAIADLDDALPVWVEAEAIAEGCPDVLHASATSASFAKGGTGGIFSGPPVDHLSIFADGVPDGTCRECGRNDGKHARWCGEDAEIVEAQVEGFMLGRRPKEG